MSDCDVQHTIFWIWSVFRYQSYVQTSIELRKSLLLVWSLNSKYGFRMCIFVFFLLGWFALPFQPQFILTESILCPVLSHSMRLYFDGSIWSGEGFEKCIQMTPIFHFRCIWIHHDDFKNKLTWYWSLGFSQSKNVKKFESWILNYFKSLTKCNLQDLQGY